jgi:alcohol dehydrogenase class IV
MTLDLRHATPAFRTYAGSKALPSLRRELDKAGHTRLVLVVAPSLLKRHLAALEPLRAALDGIVAAEFGEVENHSPLPSVQRATRVLADAQADAVVAVGGGSAVVTARAASILLAEGKDVRDLCTRPEDGRLVSPKLSAPKLPQWVVPTTPTTAYAKAGAAVRDPATGERLALYDPKARAQGVVLDPTLARTAPVGLVRSASLNALSLAVEGLRHEGKDPIADALLAQALRSVLRWLPRVGADPDDAEPRLGLILAALLAGQGSDFVPGGLAQGLSHAIGPRSDVANGTVEAMLLPATTRRFPAPEHGFGLLADLIGSPTGAPDAVADRLGEVLAGLDLPTRLRDVGVDGGVLLEITEHALDDWVVASSPHPPTHDDLLALLRTVW